MKSFIKLLGRVLELIFRLLAFIILWIIWVTFKYIILSMGWVNRNINKALNWLVPE